MHHTALDLTDLTLGDACAPRQFDLADLPLLAKLKKLIRNAVVVAESVKRRALLVAADCPGFG